MASIVRWTQRGQHEMDAVIAYYETEYSPLAAENLVRDLKKEIEKLKKQPFIGRASQKRPIVRFVLVRGRYRLYYRVHEDNLIFVGFFDTRQDPKKDPYQ